MDAKSNLDSILKKIIETKGLKNAEIQYENVTDSGYICNVNVINIKHDDSVLSLFLKRLPKQHSDALKMIYMNEKNFYENVVREFKKLDATVVSFIPTCYYLDEEVIVLENLIASGMKVWSDLRIPLDEEHVEAVMKEYGKFHAYSSALKLRSPELFNTISRKHDILKRVFTIYKESFRMSVATKAAAAFTADQNKYSEAFLHFIDHKIYDFLSDIFEDDEFDVIIHGDCWPHNFLFKYNKESQLTGVKLIDFQLSFLASRIIDLSYFFCTSACSKEHFDRIDKYLQIYHHSFSSQMEKLGYASNQIMSLKALTGQWRKHGKYGLIWGMIVNKMLIADKDELDAHHCAEVLMSFDFISRNEDLYHRKMKDSISYFYKNNIL